MRGSRVALLCGLAGTLLLALVTARGETAIPGHLQDVDLERGTGSRSLIGSARLDGSSVAEDITDELELIRTAALIAVMILFLVAVSLAIRHARRIRRRRRRLGIGVPDDEALGALDTTSAVGLRGAAARAHAELTTRRGGPPGDAVVAAWLRLEEAAEQAGAGRAAHQTPTEFTVALLARHTADEHALDELRRLYQRARFGRPGELDETDVHAAAVAIERIVPALDGQRQPT